MKNIFIITTPFQLISALEAINFFKLKNNYLVVFDNKLINNSKQLSILIDKNKTFFTQIIREYDNSKTKFFKYLRLIKNLKKINFNNIFIGDLGSIQKIIIANIKSKKVYLLDDGAKTLLVYKELNKKQFLKKIKRLRYKFFGLKTSFNKKIDIFTFFNINKTNHIEVIKHNFKYFKKVNNLVEKQVKNKVYILGQPLIENSRVSIKAYEIYLNNIIEKYIDCEIYYLMHRREELNNINSLSLEKTINIIESNVPGEHYFANLNYIPKAIVGVNTTLLFSLNVIFDKINIEAYMFRQNEILRSKEWFDEAINYFEENKIDIIRRENIF